MQSKVAVCLVAATVLAGCGRVEEKKVEITTMNDRLAKYAPVRLESDPGGLTAKERQMIPLLIDAAKLMDDLFWQQAYGGGRDRELRPLADADPSREAVMHVHERSGHPTPNL